MPFGHRFEVCDERAGLEDFAVADARFLFSIVQSLQADVSNLLSFSSANLLLKVLNGQLVGVRPQLQPARIPAQSP